MLWDFPYGASSVPDDEPIIRPMDHLSVGLPFGCRGRISRLIYTAGLASQHEAPGLRSWVPDWSFATRLFSIFGYTPPTQLHVFWAGDARLSQIYYGGLEYDTRYGVQTIVAISQTVHLHPEGQLCDDVRLVSTTLVRPDASFNIHEQQKVLTAWFLESSRSASEADEDAASLFVDVIIMSWASKPLFEYDQIPRTEKRAKDESYLKFTKSAKVKEKLPFGLSLWSPLEPLPRIVGRFFFMTDKGEAGLARHGTLIGDVLCLFVVFDSPAIVRPVLRLRHDMRLHPDPTSGPNVANHSAATADEIAVAEAQRYRKLKRRQQKVRDVERSRAHQLPGFRNSTAMRRSYNICGRIQHWHSR
ncbi:hypothetical protein C8A03DRAFT_36881 [Achaetomium macrosporum]|uniref:Uncharacterized protein n=1 Tax=Achaetomium macrosporum TaxID=79813 RepID=A0AAN7H8L0_9PEZI|nr:hypothetical protein C8A03DRAFT_36881 [Achaetomium macrosporum]